MYLEFFFWRSRKEKNTQQNQTDNINYPIAEYAESDFIKDTNTIHNRISGK